MALAYDFHPELTSTNEESTGWYEDEPSGFDSLTGDEWLEYYAHEAEMALRHFPDRQSRKAFLDELEERISAQEKIAETSEAAPW